MLLPIDDLTVIRAFNAVITIRFQVSFIRTLPGVQYFTLMNYSYCDHKRLLPEMGHMTYLPHAVIFVELSL